jgi:hypothetical protein
MTRSDKTGDKPVAPVRTAASRAARPKPVAARPAALEAPHAEPAAAAPERTAAHDPYRSAGRVWPD